MNLRCEHALDPSLVTVVPALVFNSLICDLIGNSNSTSSLFVTKTITHKSLKLFLFNLFLTVD